MSEEPSAWKDLVDSWVARESLLHPEVPILADSIKVRDAIQVGDQAYVLVSYDVKVPWPQEEDTPGEHRAGNAAVLQAARVRTPWVEADTARAASELCSPRHGVRVFEHLLGTKRACSGVADVGVESIDVIFDDGSVSTARIIDTWFIAIVDHERIPRSVRWESTEGMVEEELVREDQPPLLGSSASFSRDAGHSHYFSPLDLRQVLPIARWQKSGAVTVVATCIEQYDTGGILRLRIDGIREDDDLFTTWPAVRIESNGTVVASSVCGEYRLSDTVSLDVGFVPWNDPQASHMTVEVSGIRGKHGLVEPIQLELAVRDRGNT